MERGLVLRLEFRYFILNYDYKYDYYDNPEMEYDDEGIRVYTCDYSSMTSHLTIIDGDGTTLLKKTCGRTSPTSFTSKSNNVTLLFHTGDSVYDKHGWSIEWIAEKPGLSKM